MTREYDREIKMITVFQIRMLPDVPAEPKNPLLISLHDAQLTEIALTICICNITMVTWPYNEHPLTPHFYIGKLGFTLVYIIFLFLL